MGLWELAVIALGLSMDAFAASVCKGLSARRPRGREYLAVGLWFGGFQALMPLIGFWLGSRFQSLITAFDHWIAFVLLCLVGGNMIRESFGKAEGANASFAPRALFPLAVATSIDALAVGITLALTELRFSIFYAVTLIGMITFLLSVCGLRLGALFGARYKAIAERVGGSVLIFMGVKILLEHLGVLAWLERSFL